MPGANTIENTPLVVDGVMWYRKPTNAGRLYRRQAE
jgi:hypothetical protein